MAAALADWICPLGIDMTNLELLPQPAPAPAVVHLPAPMVNTTAPAPEVPAVCTPPNEEGGGGVPSDGGPHRNASASASANDAAFEEVKDAELEGGLDTGSALTVPAAVPTGQSEQEQIEQLSNNASTNEETTAAVAAPAPAPALAQVDDAENGMHGEEEDDVGPLPVVVPTSASVPASGISRVSSPAEAPFTASPSPLQQPLPRMPLSHPLAVVVPTPIPVLGRGRHVSVLRRSRLDGAIAYGGSTPNNYTPQTPRVSLGEALNDLFCTSYLR